jgi:phosphatidylglycerophosphatase A
MKIQERAGILLGTGLGAGYFRFGPGTLASAATIAACIGANAAGREWQMLAAAAFLFLPGCWAAGVCARAFGQPDPSRVVIDEVIGQLITAAAVPAAGPGVWKYWLGGFILFRMFDIAKPWPIRRLERLPGGYGIVSDDVMAGVYGYAVLKAATWLAA